MKQTPKLSQPAKGAPFGPSHFFLDVRRCRCLAIKKTSKMLHLQEACSHLLPCLSSWDDSSFLPHPAVWTGSIMCQQLVDILALNFDGI